MRTTVASRLHMLLHVLIKAGPARALLIIVLCAALTWPAALLAAPPQAAVTRVVSIRGGRWSNPSTWDPRGVPGAGAAATIAKGTTVEYDGASDAEISTVDVEGRFVFSRERSTRLDSGSIIIRGTGVLEIGSPDRPIPSSVTTEVRLVVPEGARFAGGDFVPGDVGIWVLDGGRWEVSGAPIRHTWVKLARPVKAGDVDIVVREDLSDWPRGADVVVTPTGSNPTGADFEERRVDSVRRLVDGFFAVRLTTPLGRPHEGGAEFAGEIALLTRNVRITSKYPNRLKAHTAFMHGAKGSIAYGEFKALGALGVLGRYPIHFHMMGDTSRGMYVRGASIWRSDNHFLNIHGSNGITIEDTVGYDAPGMGYFLETMSSGQHKGPVEKQQRVKGEQALRATPGEAGGKQRKAQERQPKGEEAVENLDNAFVHTLAAKGFWRPGSHDNNRGLALFWISSFNTILIDNVAVGARGSRDTSGFRFAEDAAWSDAATPFVMVKNESHGNSYGLFSWTNAKLAFDVVGFKAWRNTEAGIGLGAYNSRFRIIGADLAENEEYNVIDWVVRAWIQDSVLRRSKVGILFSRHFVRSDPESPALIVNTRFLDHSAADVSLDHRACEVPGEERSPDSRECSANYAIFARPQFLSRRPIDFGWHQNANSWLEVLDWPSPPAGLPPSFRIVRRDQAADGDRPSPLVDGRIRPVQRVWDYPPTVEISAEGSPARGITLRARAQDDRGIVSVDFFVDGTLIQRVTAAPYEAVWRPRSQGRRRAYVFARATDTAGNVAYSQVLQFTAPTP